MPAVKLSPLFNGQTVTASGAPASGYKLYTYAAGSSAPLATYTDSTGSVAQANPVILNANGYPANPIWLQAGLSYKFALKDANDVQVGSPWDNVSGVNDTGSAVSQWQSSGSTPTYVSATSFTLAGDQTTEFHVGRRVQCTVTSGTVYGLITASAYSSLTTITLSMDSGQVLDSGLSVVNLSILRADRLALPNAVTAAYGTRGLIGNINSTTPLTKFDLSADAVTLRNAGGALVTRFVTGTKTCDLGATGPIANGRDQSAAFAANSFIHLYFILNGNTLDTLASLTAPSSFNGSTLPAGYTHWCYATTIRWNASSNIIPVYVRGRLVTYDVSNRVLSTGVTTSFTAVSLSSFVPPNALIAKLTFTTEGNYGAVGNYGTVFYRPTGSTNATGLIGAGSMQVVASAIHSSSGTVEVVTNGSQQIDYRVATAPTSGGAFIDVIGYSVPNGDA